MAKICTRCKKKKTEKFFRKRLDKRDGRVYINSTCKKCDSEITMLYYEKHKNDPEFKRKNRQRAKQYIIENADIINAKKKKYREKPENIIRRKKYDKENHARITALSKLRNKKYLKKIVDKISDSYVLRVLRTEVHKKTGRSMNVNFSDSEIREKKRSIAIHRLNKFIKSLNDEEQNRRLEEPIVCPTGEAG